MLQRGQGQDRDQDQNQEVEGEGEGGQRRQLAQDRAETPGQQQVLGPQQELDQEHIVPQVRHRLARVPIDVLDTQLGPGAGHHHGRLSGGGAGLGHPLDGEGPVVDAGDHVEVGGAVQFSTGAQLPGAVREVA